MKRGDVLGKMRKAARARGVSYTEYDLTRHTGVTVGDARTTVPRHTEIKNNMAEVIFKQVESALGKRWWRK